MEMKMFTMNPVDRQGYSMNCFNEALAGAVHVETYTKDEGRCGGDRTITIFAFYPDEDKCASGCADHVQELLRENIQLQAELDMAKEMYPKEMRMVENTLKTVEELK